MGITIWTFATKFIFAVTFVIPVLLFPLTTAIIVSIAWGLSLLATFSLCMARSQGEKPWKVMMEHLLITLVVVITTHFVGDLIAKTFG